MAKAYRVATVRPQDRGPQASDWSERIASAGAVSNLVVRRARRSIGRGYRMGERGEGLSRKLSLRQVAKFLPAKAEGLRIGDVFRVLSLRNGVVYLVRAVEYSPTLRTVGNDDVDRIYTLVFRDLGDVGQENWGVCSRRSIGGTYLPSQHCPWADMNDTKGPGSNAIDLGGFGRDGGDRLAAALTAQPYVGKVLWNGRAWDHEYGWRVVPGIGHDDHIHAEGRNARPSEWRYVRSACP